MKINFLETEIHISWNLYSFETKLTKIPRNVPICFSILMFISIYNIHFSPSAYLYTFGMCYFVYWFTAGLPFEVLTAKPKQDRG